MIYSNYIGGMLMYDNLTEKELSVLNFLKYHIKDKGYPPSVREICKNLDIKSTSTVFGILNRLEKNKYIRKDPSKTRAIEILGDDNGSNNYNFDPEIINLPLVGSIAAGSPILAQENIEDYIGLPSAYIKGKDCFMLKIKGDSMVEVGIMDKDYIIIDAADTRADNGKIVVALINGESATVKTLEKRDGKIWLIPQNSAYEPMIFEPDQVKVMGTVTGVFRVY